MKRGENQINNGSYTIIELFVEEGWSDIISYHV